MHVVGQSCSARAPCPRPCSGFRPKAFASRSPPPMESDHFMCFACGCHLAWRAYRIKTFRNNQITVKVASFVAVVEFGVVFEASIQARQARVQVSTNERLCASVARKPLEDVLARRGCQTTLSRSGRVDIVNIVRSPSTTFYNHLQMLAHPVLVIGQNRKRPHAAKALPSPRSCLS